MSEKNIITFPYSKFEQLCNVNKVTPYRVAEETEISTATLSNWKQGNYVPKADKMYKIARHFDVPMEYFIEEVEIKEN